MGQGQVVTIWFWLMYITLICISPHFSDEKLCKQLLVNAITWHRQFVTESFNNCCYKKRAREVGSSTAHSERWRFQNWDSASSSSPSSSCLEMVQPKAVSRKSKCPMLGGRKRGSGFSYSEILMWMVETTTTSTPPSTLRPTFRPMVKPSSTSQPAGFVTAALYLIS